MKTSQIRTQKLNIRRGGVNRVCMYYTNYQGILPEQMLSSIHRMRVTGGAAQDMVLPRVPVQITDANT